MPGSPAEEKKRAAEVLTALSCAYPEAGVHLAFRDAFQLLAATILSAQCTDDQVNKVTATFFKKANTPQKIARMKRESLEAAFRSTGFFRNKAKSVHEMSRMLVEKFGGRVPREMEALLTLPGVARKTANVVRAAAFGLPAIITDTHFIRLSQRMGLTANEKPEKIERDVAALLPESEWSAFSHALLFHGRAVCQAKKPACDRCVVNELCPSAFRFPHFEGDGGAG